MRTVIIAGVFLACPLLAQVEDPKQGEAARPAKAEKAKPKLLEIGKAVDASVSLRDIHGNVHTFKDYRGKVVVVNFWSITCPWLKGAEPKLSAIHREYADKDVVVLGINANRNEIGKPPKPEDFKKKAKDGDSVPYPRLVAHVKKKNVPFAVLADHGNKVADLFQAKTTPHCFVLDRKGVVRYSGALDDDMRCRKGDDAEQYVRDAVVAVLAGEDVKVETTRPYG